MPDEQKSDGKPKKKTAALRRGPAARTATQAAQAAQAMQGGLLAGVEEVVARSFIGQGVAAAASDQTPAPAAPTSPTSVITTGPKAAVPPSRAESSGAQPSAPLDVRSAEQPPATSTVRVSATQEQPEQPPAEEPTGQGTRNEREVPAKQPQQAPTASTPSTNDSPITPRAETSADASGQQALRPAPAPAPLAAQPAQANAEQDTEAPGQERALGWAHKAVINSWTESTIDVKLHKNEWETHPFRFTPDLIDAMSKRVANDRRSSGNQLTVAQYVDAAMANLLPHDLDAQIALAERFLRKRGQVPAGRQSSHRVSPAVYAVVSKLPDNLRAAGRGRTAVHIYSAVMDQFLEQLEAEGPLK